MGSHPTCRKRCSLTDIAEDHLVRFPRQGTKLTLETGENAGGKRDSQPSWLPPAPASDLPEQLGRYRILRMLGQGGMGSVYLAWDTQLERHVALKVPHFTEADEADARERFMREAKAAATIDHPNICPVYEIGVLDGIPYLTMAYVEGQSLADVLAEKKRLEPRQAAALVRKLALALAEAHSRGVIHRDLKPGNVMINHRREPVVMDFGLACRSHQADPRLTPSGFPLGTPAYMAPEQVAGDLGAMGPGCDVYSLGVILFEVLTGRVPFDGPVPTVLAKILTQPPPAPTRYRPDLDPELTAVCLKALAKKIKDRFATMEEMARDLTDYLRLPNPKPRPTLTADTDRPFFPAWQRFRWTLWAFALVLLAARLLWGHSHLAATPPAPGIVEDNMEPVEFICRGGRIYPYRVSRLSNEFDDAVRTALNRPQGNLRVDPNSDLPTLAHYFANHYVGDEWFRLRVMGLVLKIEPLEINQGESLDQLLQEGSVYAKAYRAADPAKQYLIFHVWEDSFDVYREARQLAERAGLLARWVPYARGEDLEENLGQHGGGGEAEDTVLR